MTERKTPILLRRGPFSGEVYAIYRYRRKVVRGRDVIDAQAKQAITADYDALVLMELVDDGAEDIVGILDGVADGKMLTEDERVQVRTFRERLRALVERHNVRCQACGSYVTEAQITRGPE
jgi:hypothetical protein